MKRRKPKINLEHLQLISEANEANLRGDLKMAGRDIVIHTSCGDDVI